MNLPIKTTLKRHYWPDDPNWIIINESVPLGTEYKVLGFEKLTIINFELGRKRSSVPCYLVQRGNEDPGYIPTVCFE